MRTKLHKHLNTILPALDNVPYVNQGGCGVVALGLLKHIRNTYPKFRPKVVYILREWDMRGKTNLQNNVPDSAMHVMLRIGKIYIDSEGLHTKKELRSELLPEGAYLLETTEEYLTQALTDPSVDWNTTFNRLDSVPTIASILNIHTNFLYQT